MYLIPKKIKNKSDIFLGFGFTPLANVALGGSSPIASEYQAMFNGLLEKYK